MEHILQLFIFIPFVGLIISIFIPKKYESLISWTAFSTILLQLSLLTLFILYWIITSRRDLNLNEITLLKTRHYEFFIDFYFDKVAAIFMLIGAFLSFLVTTYSRYYLHRERGYKRFFNTILFFYLGYNIAVLAGNFETLFMGWEIIGVSSFLLIAFYRERYLPVTNAFKVFSIYRIGDIGIILAMWASHHLWHENITFMKLNNYTLVSHQLQEHSAIGIFISLAILLAASAKSAQFPFSSWLPRAMEGPTPSSAIFYGSLSVHLGAFLMLRTFPFWEHQIIVRVIIILLGLSTSIIASFIANVQSSVKAQIAYSSISQIGLIFIEIALGLEIIALIHIAGNAFLRTYQLIVSPSVVSYMIKEQFYDYESREHTFEDSFPKKLENSLYIISLNEFKLESFMSMVFWNPLKKIGKMLDFLTVKTLILFFIPTYIMGIFCYIFRNNIPASIIQVLPTTFAFLGMVSVFKAYSERNSPFLAWTLIVLNHFGIALAILFNENVDYKEIILYLLGVIVSGLLGIMVLYLLYKKEEQFTLNKYLGHIYEHKKYAFIFLISALGVTGFPITTTFIGEDLIFSHIHSNQILLAIFTSQSFIIGGLAAIRIYARLFLGPHCKTYHELPYQSS
jgi:NADH-quinone oxidoreductase subunit L